MSTRETRLLQGNQSAVRTSEAATNGNYLSLCVVCHCHVVLCHGYDERLHFDTTYGDIFIEIFLIALNADNLAANRVIYVTATGCVDIVSYILSIILLRYFGRKVSSCGLFALSGFFLLSLLVVPRSKSSPHQVFVHSSCFLLNMQFLLQAAHIGSSSWPWLAASASAPSIPLSHCTQPNCSRPKFVARHWAPVPRGRTLAQSRLHTSSTSWYVALRNSAYGSYHDSRLITISFHFLFQFQGQISWFIPTTICGILIVVAGLLTLTHPETRARQLKD